MDIKVLGTGCVNCRTTVSLIEEVAKEKGATITLTKVEDLRQIASYGVMRTPAVVIDGKVVHSGGVPLRGAVDNGFANKNDISQPRNNATFDGALMHTPHVHCANLDT